MQTLEQFEVNRGRLFGLAYRMLGEAMEAEDVLQDAYLRWVRSENVKVPAAWLTKIVTNLCLNRLTSARARRESYVGPWLPEPVLTEDDTRLGPLETVEQRDSLSMGMLVLLERLTPAERAAFVLREAFDYSHREIAEVLEVDETNARQLFSRARAHLGEARKRFTPSEEQSTKIVQRFLAATMDGDVAGLERMLAEDVEAWGDGGGKVSAARRPVFGRSEVARFMTGLSRTVRGQNASYSIAMANGEPAILVHEAGELTVVLAIECTEDRVRAIRAVVNPDKLSFVRAQQTTS